MASIAAPFLRTSTRSLRRNIIPALAPAFARSISTKHPAGFTPPSEDELLELRERVQDFTSMLSAPLSKHLRPRLTITGREIPAEVAARTDEVNNFPAEMWKKLGDAGYVWYILRGEWYIELTDVV